MCKKRQRDLAKKKKKHEKKKEEEENQSKIWAGTRQVMHRHTRTPIHTQHVHVTHIHTTHTTGNKQLKGTSFFMELN